MFMHISTHKIASISYIYNLIETVDKSIQGEIFKVPSILPLELFMTICDKPIQYFHLVVPFRPGYILLINCQYFKYTNIYHSRFYNTYRKLCKINLSIVRYKRFPARVFVSSIRVHCYNRSPYKLLQSLLKCQTFRIV